MNFQASQIAPYGFCFLFQTPSFITESSPRVRFSFSASYSLYPAIRTDSFVYKREYEWQRNHTQKSPLCILVPFAKNVLSYIPAQLVTTPLKTKPFENILTDIIGFNKKIIYL